jgi:hypothetical protein
LEKVVQMAKKKKESLMNVIESNKEKSKKNRVTECTKESEYNFR